MNPEVLEQNIFSLKNEDDFTELALRIFRFQAEKCSIYRQFIRTLNIFPDSVSTLKQIPFLPISFFKSHEVITEGFAPEIIFTSSGTTGMTTSAHAVAKSSLYQESYMKGFELFYGNPGSYCILALLPGYLERSGSSLIYMLHDLIKRSNDKDSGFYLNEHTKLEEILLKKEAEGKQTLLLGVSFALLDFFENRKFQLKHTLIMETGGMKGRRKEIIREELHEILTKASGLSTIHSEYGMTELLSQAYSKGKGLFTTPPWMKLLIREATDPFSYATEGKTGGINVIDLANLYSCSFIATQDLGRQPNSEQTEILGRFDNSDIRGCSLMV